MAKWYLSIIILLLWTNALFGSLKQSTFQRIDQLANVPDKHLEDSARSLFPVIFSFDAATAEEMFASLIEVNNGRNPRATLLCLYGMSSFIDQGKIAFLDSAIQYAKGHKINDFDLTHFKIKSQFYYNEGRIDSSIHYLLKARDYAKKLDLEDYVDVLHLLGDHYYRVKLFDEAEKYYLKVDSLKGNMDSWDYWRKYVINNNLGLIELEKGNHENALGYFDITLKRSEQALSTYADSLRKCYIHRMVGKTYIEMGELQTAHSYISFAFSIAKYYHLREHLFDLYLSTIKIFLQEDTTDSIRWYFNEMKNYYQTIAPSLSEQKGYASINLAIYEYFGQTDSALYFCQLKSTLSDSLSSYLRNVGVQQVISERNYKLLNTSYRKIKLQQIYLLLIILLLIAFAIAYVIRSNKIARLNRLLKESNQSKDKLFSIIAHDLKSPFNALLGLSELLNDKIEQHDMATSGEYAKHIDRSLNETYNTIKNLLEWSRSQLNSFHLSTETTDIKELIAEAVNIHTEQASLKQIRINASNTQSHYVEVDRNSMITVFSNLLSNAIKFSHLHSEITIETKGKNTLLEISISDNGVGIPPKRMDSIFKSDFNNTTPGTNNEIGTGLGLLICKEFVEKNGGTLSVISQQGKGTTFIVTLTIYRT